MFSTAISSFHEEIDFSVTKINKLPSLILVLGGPKVLSPLDASLRNVFITKMYEGKHELAQHLHSPEDFPEWNQFEGYTDLIHFEIDIGSLTRTILLFSESAGTHAELGAFCMDRVLSDRLLVVIQKIHYDQDSFIRHGPIRKIQGSNPDDSVYVIQAKTPAAFVDEVQDVADVLGEKFHSFPKTIPFRVSERRDWFLLLADLVELFGALTQREIGTLLTSLNFPFERTDLARSLKLLQMLRLVLPGVTDKHYYVAPKDGRQSYLDYDAAPGRDPFERIKYKTKLVKLIAGDRQRLKAYRLTHGGGQ